MKKQISFLLLGFFLMISTLPIQATPGRLKDASITSCNGFYYGKHGKDNHWHLAKQNKDGSYAAIGEILVNGNPCNPSDTNNVIINNEGNGNKHSGESNQVKTGWIKSNNDWQYFNSKGQMQSGWQKVNNNWFYLNEQKIMQTGWTKVKGKWFLMNSSGRMQTGWSKVNNAWYYMNNSGHMQKGWQKLNGNWYYLNNSGVMQTGSHKIGNKMYHFDSSGKMK